MAGLGVSGLLECGKEMAKKKREKDRVHLPVVLVPLTFGYLFSPPFSAVSPQLRERLSQPCPLSGGANVDVRWRKVLLMAGAVIRALESY